MTLTKTKYSVQELMELTSYSRTKISRIAKISNWKVIKEKEGRVYKNYYLATDVQELFPKEEEKKEVVKEKSNLVKLIEKENSVKSLDDVSEKVRKVTIAKHVLCRELNKALNAYERLKNKAQENRTYKKKDFRYKKGAVYSNFLETYKEKYEDIYEILGDISENTLRRWLKQYEEEEPEKLIPQHMLSQTRGLRKLSPQLRENISKLYLNPNKPSISQVYKRLQGLHEELPTYETIRNYINYDIPQILKDKHRMGNKEFKDTYETFVLRDYSEDSIKSNDLWVSDGHDLELMCKHPDTGKIVSPKIIVWQDMASRLWTGWSTVFYEDSESIITSLRRGIEKYGKPKALYTDNGKAYKGERVQEVYRNLDLKVTHAIPYNAKAKPIERTFRDFKESFAKFSLAYKGGHILERPERLKEVVKHSKDRILEFRELEEALEDWIEWRNRQVHRGHGMKGRSPLERFNEECPLETREYVNETLLNELLLYSKERVVQQYGIQLYNQYYKFSNFPLWIGQKVLVKYDYDDLKTIWIYEDTGKLISKAQPVELATFKDSVSAIKDVNRAKKLVNKTLRDYNEALKEYVEKDLTGIYIEDNKAYREVSNTEKITIENNDTFDISQIEMYE